MNTITIYTDGACSGNPGPGGWGAMLIAGQRRKEIHGGVAHTTNNQMELRAAIEALKALKTDRYPVILITDSKYVIEGITKWITGWKRRGWRTSKKEPVANKELWQELDTLNSRYNVTWKWVKGHNKDPGNDRADELSQIGVALGYEMAREDRLYRDQERAYRYNT